jgi:hypothetical protein
LCAQSIVHRAGMGNVQADGDFWCCAAYAAETGVQPFH